MAKRQPKFDVDFKQRKKQRDIAKGIRDPDPVVKGHRKNAKKKYAVFLRNHDDSPNVGRVLSKREWVFINILAETGYGYSMEWLSREEVIEKKLMGYEILPIVKRNYLFVK